MSHPSLRPLGRRVGLLAVSALTLGTLTGVATAPAQAAEPDPAPAAAGAEWLAGELTDGLIVNPNFGGFTDYGLSIDTGLALSSVGGQDATVSEISDALAAEIDSYTTGADFGSSDVYSGAVAKATAFAQVAGDDPTSYGGVDLVDRLESLVLSDGPIDGRLADQTEDTDFANSIGQAFGARALDAAGSTTAAAATDFLLAQQCDGGFFRLSFAAVDAPDQTCDGDAEATPSVDATALALVNLAEQSGDPDVDAALASGLTWLQGEQAGDGSFGGAPPTAAPNANSTGLAGWALGQVGDTEDSAAAAEDAAAYVRSLQADDTAPCTTALSDETGAVAYDGAALAAAREEGITDATSDQFRRATAQALPTLRYAPSAQGNVAVAAKNGYLRGGSKTRVAAANLAPGDTVCFAIGRRTAATTTDASGTARTRLDLPVRTRRRQIEVSTTAGVVGGATVAVLGRTKPRLTLKKGRVRRGARQVAVVRGLESRESVTFRLGKKKVDTGTANRRGAYKARFRVKRKPGRVKVKVFGEFRNRRNAEAFRVTRRR